MASHLNTDRTTLWLGLALALVVGALYWPVRHHDFIRYDDPAYVQENPRVLTGLTVENVVWAFTTGHSSNWHPVTWLSHMLDAEFFGKTPGGHHLTSVAFHAVNAFLLFLFLTRVTNARAPSLLVAALYAFHPLRVESVAWISERKDVLSMFFFLVMLLAYSRYVESSPARAQSGQEADPGLTRRKASVPYAFALLFFALGLMSKPMLVTVPFLLLVLDFWPFGRITPPGTTRQWQALLLEKIPFLLLTLASICVTYLVQEKAHAVTMVLPFGARLANAVASYWQYLGKTFWPVDLAVFYPHPDTRYPESEQWPMWVIALTAAGLLAITLFAFARMNRAPAFASGWFWYLGTLVPVIGLVQVGGQGMADRYTYLPHVGLFVAIIWPAWAFLSRRTQSAAVLKSAGAVGAGIAIIFAFLSHQQIKLWRDTETLFTHALRVTRNNSVAHVQLGSRLGERGQFEQAIEHFNKAIQAAPASADGYFGLGFTYELQNRLEQAMEHYQSAARIRPWDDRVLTRMAGVLYRLGRDVEAVSHWREAIRLNPEAFEPRLRIAIALSRQGAAQEAEGHFRKALAIEPLNKEAIGNFAEHCLRLGRYPEAEGWFRRLVQLEPKNPDFLVNLGAMIWSRGGKDEAMQLYRRAVEAGPSHAIAHQNLAMAAYDLKMFGEAERHFRRAAELDPAKTFPLIGLSRALIQQGRAKEAIPHARQAVSIDGDNPNSLSVLDTALAAAGDFDEAIQWAAQAQRAAMAKGDAPSARAAEQRIELYKNKQPPRLP